MTLLPESKSAQVLWRTVTRLDKSKINTWVAFRNSLAVAIPLGCAIAMHNPLAGVAIATGALNVAYSDGRDPYGQRARRMFAWAVLGAIAVFIGSLTGRTSWLAILVAGAYAFLAGLLISVSTRAGDLGLNTLVALIVYAARGAMSLGGASAAGALVLLGGLVQMLFALAFWPLRRYEPERAVIGATFCQIATEIDPTTADPLTTPLDMPSQQVQDTIAALGRDHSVEGERYRMLFDQADRIRMSVFVLQRLRSELLDENRGHDISEKKWADHADHILLTSANVLRTVGSCLTAENCLGTAASLLQTLDTALQTCRDHESDTAAPIEREVCNAIDILAGQLRLVVQLASHSLPEGSTEFARTERSHPWRLQVSSWIGTMHANFDMSSPFFRHAIRLSACVALSDALGRMISWDRTYWIPMTLAVVLKPDFTTTISRGVLRLAGTFAGLMVATVLYHLIPPSALSEVFLVGIFTYMLRSIGPANYGVFSVAISGLIVFLIAETGIAPKDVVVLRALNTTAGGIAGLLAYVLWPTWERTRVSDVVAEMVEACRSYFRAVAERFGSDEAMVESELDSYRTCWRRTRSNAEASVDRVASEPGANAEQVTLLTSILASSRALVHSIMGLEAAVLQGHARTAPEVFQQFAHDVDFTLYFVSAALRGSPAAAETLPSLREDHSRMLKTRSGFSPIDELVLIETDRLTSSVNTLREQVMRFAKQSAEVAAYTPAPAIG